MTVDRRTYIGGSDAAAIAGVGLWGSPYSVWLSKTSEEPEENEASERMQWGLLLEGPVAEEWARREGVTKLRRAPFRRMPDAPHIGGHPDFLGDHPADGPVVIECKLSDRPGTWSDGDEDRVPLQYFLQVQHYMLITGRQVAYLVVLIRGNELRSFRIERDEEVIAGLVDAYDEFWSRVLLDTPPEVDGHEATAEALKRRYPRADESEKVADLTEVGLIESLLAVRREAAKVGAEETEILNRLKDRMGSVSRMISPVASITWKNNKDSTKTDWQSVAKAYRMALEKVREMEGDFYLRTHVLDGADLDALESIHTNTIPGARVFRVTKAEEQG